MSRLFSRDFFANKINVVDSNVDTVDNNIHSSSKQQNYAGNPEPFKNIAGVVLLCGMALLSIPFSTFLFSKPTNAATISLSVSDSITATALPSSGNNTFTSDTNTTNISVSTTNVSGYTLSLKSNSSSAPALTSANGSISSISSQKSSVNNFDAGTWGYKPTKKNGNTWSNLTVKHGSTTYTSGYYLPGPTTTEDILDTTNSANSSTEANQYNLAIATKLGSTTLSGTYSNSFTVIAVANPLPVYNISYNLDGGTAGTDKPTSATYDTGFNVSNPTKDGYNFTGWTITGMDSTTHYYGTSSSSYSTSTATSLSSITSTWFKNLRASTGTVTFTAGWEKIFAWEKYASSRSWTEAKSGSTSTQSVSRTNARSYYYGSSYSFNEMTGNFTVDQNTKPSSSASCSSLAGQYYIQFSTSRGRKTGRTVYYINSASGSTTCTLNLYTYTSTQNGSYIQSADSTYLGTVTSSTENAYPDNGRGSDGYWYIKKVYMQDITPEYIANMVTNQQVLMIDKRDNKSYYVAKLGDGNVWMTQNLSLNLNTSTTLTPDDSEVTQNWTPTSVYTSGCVSAPNEYETVCVIDYASDYYTPFSADDGNWIEADSLPKSSEHQHYTAGKGYSWYAATAGTGIADKKTDGTQSICPKGWMLPYGRSTDDKSTYNLFRQSGIGPHNYYISPFYLFYDRHNIGDYVTVYWTRDYNYELYGTYRAYVIAEDDPQAQMPAESYYDEAVRCVSK